MSDDVKGFRERITAAMERIAAGHSPMRIPADMTDPDIVLSDCLARIEGEAARTAEAVAAETALCARQCAEALERSLEDEREVSQSLREQLMAAEARIAELEYERVGNHLVSFSAYDVMSRAERDRDALRASWREAVEVAERNAIDCAHLRHSAIALEAERDALLLSIYNCSGTCRATVSKVKP